MIPSDSKQVDNDLKASYLKQALKENSIKNIPNFNEHFIDLLPKRSKLAQLVETIARLVPSFITPLSQTGLARREIDKQATVLEYASTPITLKEKSFNEFNLTPPIPYYSLELSHHQRQALIELLEQNPNNSNLHSLAAKYLNTQTKYTLAELSVKERGALDEVNFRATQNYLNDLAPVLNDPNSGINQHAQQHKTYHYKNALIAETLSKSLAYNDKIDQREIVIPVEVEGTMKFVNYKIEKQYLGEKLPFYVFTPISTPVISQTSSLNATEKEIKQYAQPWVVIRGTEPLLTEDKEGAQESIAADVKDANGVSSLPIWQRSDELLVLLAQLKEKTGQRINITGHSLGGTLAQAMAVIYNPLVDQTFAFNSPGVDKNIHDFAMELDKQVQDKIVVFHRAGDIVSSASPKRIGQNFEIISTLSAKEQNDAFVKHSDMMLNIPHRQTQVDIKKDEKNWMRRFSDWNRRTILSKTSSLLVDANLFGWFKNRQALRDFASKYLNHIKAANFKSEG